MHKPAGCTVAKCLFVLCRLADELLSIEAESSTSSSSATQVEQSGNSDLSRKWTLISLFI